MLTSIVVYVVPYFRKCQSIDEEKDDEQTESVEEKGEKEKRESSRERKEKHVHVAFNKLR
jgi:F0F1-type ATP synthase epsilon subunit